VKGNLVDKLAFSAALKAADFQSVKGKFSFNHNHMPIQDFFAFEIVKDGNRDRYTHKTIGVAMADAQDAYHAACPMQ
jgi:branched-chain amino acid transport system substrate-binding protein